LVAVPVVELSITDDSQLGSLESFLRSEMPEVAIDRLAGAAKPSALGWEDVLTLIFAGVSALAEAVEFIRTYLESRGRETGVTITATNASKRRTKTLVVRNATSAQVKDFADWLVDE
jgi:hypothetical protein